MTHYNLWLIRSVMLRRVFRVDAVPPDLWVVGCVRLELPKIA